MKKRMVLALLTGLFLALGCMGALADSGIRLQVFGSIISCDVPPILENDRTLVPLRSVFESMEADVNWNGQEQQVTVDKDGLHMVLTIGSNTAYVNGTAETMDVAPRLVNDRTMIPVRFVSEKLGYRVDWDGSSQTVIIEQPKSYAYLTKIELEQTPNDNLLNLAMDRYQEPAISTLGDPFRIVLDFTDTQYAPGSSKTVVNTGWVKEVRWASHGDDYRVVIECNGEQPYRFVKTGDTTFSVIVGTAETSQAAGQPEDETPAAPVEPEQPPSHQTKPKDQILVMIDAGHGGKDPGAMPKGEDGSYLQYNGRDVQEKDITLSIALKVRDALAASGVNVQMTRDTDTYLELAEIGEIANQADADLFVSIHCNSYDASGPNGVEVLTYSTEGKDAYGITSDQIAQNILDEYVPATGFYNRGIKDGSWLAVLKRTNMPGVLVETGFLTNPNDLAALLDDGMQTKMAQAIANGIIKSIAQMP